MTIFFTADTHFGHDNIIGYCKRPFGSVEEMDEAIVERWNAVVGPGDHVWHIGDFASSPTPERYFRRLAGQKHLVVGNHDSARTRGLPWASTREMGTVKVGSTLVFACHYPMRTWPHAAHGALHVFGHVHGTLRDTKRSVDVGVDRWDFAPVSIEQIQARMAESEPSPDYPETP